MEDTLEARLHPVNYIMTKLYENKNDDADITFAVHEKEIKGHKAIIAAHSEELRGWMNTPLVDEKGRHLFQDKFITVEDFENFKKCLYLGTCNIDLTNVAKLSKLAHMYNVRSLSYQCGQFIYEQCYIAKRTIEICEFALLQETEVPQLIEDIVKFLPRYGLESFCYIGTDKTRKLASIELIQKLTSACRRTPNLDEDKLLRMIFEWAKASVEDNHTASENTTVKEFMEPLMNYIDFESVSIHSWVNIIHPNGLAPADECLKNFALFLKAPTGDNTLPLRMVKEIQNRE